MPSESDTRKWWSGFGPGHYDRKGAGPIRTGHLRSSLKECENSVVQGSVSGRISSGKTRKQRVSDIVELYSRNKITSEEMHRRVAEVEDDLIDYSQLTVNGLKQVAVQLGLPFKGLPRNKADLILVIEHELHQLQQAELDNLPVKEEQPMTPPIFPRIMSGPDKDGTFPGFSSSSIKEDLDRVCTLDMLEPGEICVVPGVESRETTGSIFMVQKYLQEGKPYEHRILLSNCLGVTWEAHCTTTVKISASALKRAIYRPGCRLCRDIRRTIDREHRGGSLELKAAVLADTLLPKQEESLIGVTVMVDASIPMHWNMAPGEL